MKQYEYKVTSTGVVEVQYNTRGDLTDRQTIEPDVIPIPDGEGWESCGFCYGEGSLWWTWRRAVPARTVVCPYCEKSQSVNGDLKVRKHINPGSNKPCLGSGRAAAQMKLSAEGAK